uniref:Uncharacterized protein n=1 Tax=Arundo donax TaxID=35708 RepID=A0A0A9DVG5_ARUDO
MSHRVCQRIIDNDQCNHHGIRMYCTLPLYRR